jgi:hypothetical protein
MMPEQIENRMVVDSQWSLLEECILKPIEEKLKEPGYREIGTDLFVPQSEAYNYALQRCLNGTESDQKEFKEMLVEWFYSGNWVKE